MQRLASRLQKIGAIVCSLLLVPLGIPITFAQESLPPSAQPAPPQLLTADQLDNLVAPVALYPDPLLSEVLAASTYPLEVVEAEQWLQQNRDLHGSQALNAAKQQNWDPSVQALAAFPDALKLLNSDIRWTTDLGNAFLAQQADVMAAIQRMRARAQTNGKLANTAQQVVTTQTQDGQSAIVIQPANPQVIYVPVYSPYYVWGPPAWPLYADLWYPGFAFGFGFGPPYFIGGLFAGWPGWGGWGWGFNWFGGGLFVNATFFHNYGFAFRGYGFRGGFGSRLAWAHDPGHRLGIPYANRQVASRFGGRFSPGVSRFNAGGVNGPRTNAFRSGATGGWRGLGGGRGPGNAGPNYRGGSAGIRAGGQTFHGGAQNYRGFANHSAPSFRSGSPAGRSFASRGFGPGSGSRAFAPRQTSPAPRFSGPSFAGGGHSFGGGGIRSFGGGHSFGGSHSFGGGGRSFGGARSFGGGGHAGGGGHGGRR